MQWFGGTGSTMNIPSQLQGSGLKSATLGVMYTKKIGKVHKFRGFPRHLKKSGC